MTKPIASVGNLHPWNHLKLWDGFRSLTYAASAD